MLRFLPPDGGIESDDVMNLRFGNKIEYFDITLPAQLNFIKSEGVYAGNRAQFQIVAGAWKSNSIEVTLMTNEILEFLQPLPRLIKTLEGMAELNSIEHRVEVKVIFDSKGTIIISGNAADSDNGNRLEFKIKTDQTFFAEIPAQIEKYLAVQNE